MLENGVYQGSFKNGLKEGKGLYKYPNGDVYEGEWLNNEKSGYGIYKYSEGFFYEGNFKHNLKDGPGKFHKDGLIIEGLWEQDELVEHN